MKMGSEGPAPATPFPDGGGDQITDIAGVFACLASIARASRMAAVALVLLPASTRESLRECIAFTDLPDAFLQAFDATQPLRTAPMFTRLRTSSAPQSWSLDGAQDSLPVEPTADNRRLLERFSITAGASVPLSGADGSRALLCLFGSRPLVDERHLADLTLGAIRAYDQYCRLKAHPPAETPRLSDREIQVLGWAANGKTSVEIATILSLSDHTVNSYLNSAMRKMDCVNRTQLVAKALRLRIIS